LKFKTPTKHPSFSKPELLLQELPKPLHTITPRFILGNSEWKRLKQKASLDNNYCCWCCGVNVNDTTPQRLEGAPIFHVEYEYKMVYFRGVAAVCYMCNQFLNLRKVIDSAVKHNNTETLFQIRLHGDALVNVVDKLINIFNASQINDFQNWRYNFNGVEYFSPFKNVDEYNAFFNVKKVK
jgi:hypothetical protein